MADAKVIKNGEKPVSSQVHPSGMLEILSVTDAAVKALNRSTFSQSSASSKGSIKSHHSEAHGGLIWSEKSHNGNQYYKNKGSAIGIAAQGKEQEDNSVDSGIIKTCSKSENTKSSKRKVHQNGSFSEAEHHNKSSDESTTASDVLIRSTVVEQPNRSLHELDMSVTSKCSKTSFGMENFNSSGPQKVKIAAKHLREIKSPIEDDRRSQASGDIQSYKIVQISGTSNEILDKSLPGEVIHGTQRGVSDPSKKISSPSRNGDVNSKSRSQRNVNRNSQNFQENEKVARYREDKVRREETLLRDKTSTYSTGQNGKTLSKANHISSLKKPEADGDNNGSHKMLSREITEEMKVHDQKPEKCQHSEAEKEDTSEPVKCNSKYYIERHTPKKNIKNEVRMNMELPEKKNLLQELEDSVDIIPQKQGHDSSCSSIQPEIVTIPECIVTVSARTSVSPSPLGSDNDSLINTPPALEWQQDRYRKPESSYAGQPGQDGQAHSSVEQDGHNKQQGRFYFTRGHYLKQGAPVSGADAPDKIRGQDDVQISQFKLTEKQRLAKGALVNRNNNAGPVKRKVQPKFISKEYKPDSIGGSSAMMKPQANIVQTTEAITAAVAASAAVAATQPFLKAQSDLEAKMAQILNKMTEGQRTEHIMSKTSEESERVKALEKQLHDLTEERIKYLENLQQQQIAMQAHLLSLTRDVTSSTYTRGSTAIRSPSHSPEAQKKQYAAISQPKKAFSKTTVSNAAQNGKYGDKKHVSRVDAEYSSPLDTPAPRSRAPKPVAFDNSDIAPRSRTHSPQRTDKDRGILEQILDYAGSPVTEKSKQSSRSPVREPRSFEIPQVQSHDASDRKANEIVNEISSLKKQIKGLVSDAEQLKNYTRETSPISVRASSYIPKDNHYGPSPLDPYLELPESCVKIPYKTIPDMDPIRFNAPLLPGFKDAEGILRQVQKSRGYLEANLESVMKARQETEVFSLLQAVYHDSSDQERVRIKQLVDEKVTKMRKEIEREVTDERVWEEINKKKPLQVPGAAKPMPASVNIKPYSRGAQRQGPTTAAKADSGLSRQTGKQTTAVMNKRPAGKENIPQRPKPLEKPKQRSTFEDEEYMTRVYGKALYQKGRTTLKAPYIHLQNDPKQKPGRLPGVQEVKGIEVKSSKAQTAPAVKQYYFNPTDGTYIPVSVASGAPIQGQLIPMAVPLGEPRLDPGLKMPTSISMPSDPVSTAHRVVPPTATRNVALVSLPVELPKKEKHLPELGKQVLPAVDIDTDISDTLEVTEPYLQSAMSAERTRSFSRSPKRSRSPPKSPKKTRSRSQSPPKIKTVKMVHVESPAESPTKTELDDTVPGENNQVKEEEEDEETYVEEDDADVESATGIELPGYQAPELPPQEQRNPVFPLRLSSGVKQMTSDLIAEDIRRRDALQNKAIEWIEQELMAQMIMELFPLRQQEAPQEINHVVSEESEDSMTEDREDTMFIIDSIGRGGLQLFVDAGMPVNNELVQELVRDVVTEKIRTMLGQKPDEESEPKLASRQMTTTGQADLREPHPEGWEQHLSRQVRTPEPTPKQSPTSSPPRRISPPITPETSPRFVSHKPEPVFVMPEPIAVPTRALEVRESESEPESSVSFDIKEELQRLAGELIVQEDTSVTQINDVATPPASPKPEMPSMEETQLPTPPMLSPRLAKKEPVPETSKVEKKPESPQSMSNPESPQPEENPEPIESEEPKPMEFRAIPRDEMPVIQQADAEKPLPSADESISKARPISPPTESESITESTQSDTINEIISEGQWFLDKSEGEVAEFQIDEIARQRLMAQTTRRKVDASTLKDTEDLDLLEESAELDRSDGEFIYRTLVAPEDDPVLNLLAKLQHQSQYQPVVYGQYEMSPNQVQELLKVSGKSVGEVTLLGTVRSEGEITVEAPRKSREQIRYPERYLDPQRRRESPTRVSFEADRQLAEYDRPLRDSTVLDEDMPQEDVEIPERDMGRKSPARRVIPGGRQTQAQSINVTAGGRTSPIKSALKRPPMITRSGSIPEMRGSRLVQVRSSSEDLQESQDNYSAYEGITYGSRAMTPDQMNMDSLIQSGYLSQSFSQSENGKIGQPGGAASLRSSLMSSTEFHQSSHNRLTGKRNSLGLTYSMEIGDSENEEDLQQEPESATGTLKMKVTIPQTSDQEDESGVSEIDITDGNTR